jgi:hypothetical protein
MADDSASHYFDFYRANLNGEKKSTDRFLGSNLQCCLHATVLPAVKYLEGVSLVGGTGKTIKRVGR